MVVCTWAEFLQAFTKKSLLKALFHVVLRFRDMTMRLMLSYSKNISNHSYDAASNSDMAQIGHRQAFVQAHNIGVHGYLFFRSSIMLS
jgi:hypothetical protein